MDYTLEISDSQAIGESLGMSGNNIKLSLAITITITEEIDSAYFIVRTGDTTFIRSDIP